MRLRAATYPDAPVGTPSADLKSELGLPPTVIVALIGVSLLGFLTPNPLLTVGALAILPLLAALAWRPGEPPLLLFILGFQWLQASAKVFHANLLGQDITEVILFANLEAPQTKLATWLSLAGLLALAAGIRLVIRRIPPTDVEALTEQVNAFSIPRAFWMYLAVSIGLTALYQSVGYYSAFRQILLAASLLKWSAFFFLGYLVFFRRESYIYFLLAFGIEFVGGIGFFSGFKEVIFVSVIAFFSVNRTLTVGAALKGVAVVAVMIVMGAAWTSVKAEYRGTISEDAVQQGSTLSQSEQVELLYNLVSGLDGQALQEGLDPLLARVGYVDFFGYVLNAVPSVIDHANGELWGSAVRHVLVPRLINPNKPALPSDSEITTQYTGIYLPGADRGTSISIGYMGESYADFGFVGMFVPIFLVGVSWGLIYAFFVRKARYRVLGYAYSVAILLSAYQLEVATIKLVGGVLMKFIVIAFIFRFTEDWVADWLRGDKAYTEDAVDEEYTLPEGAESGAWA